MPEDKGRIDWMPRLGMWKVIVYKGSTDAEVARYEKREDAVTHLRQAIRA